MNLLDVMEAATKANKLLIPIDEVKKLSIGEPEDLLKKMEVCIPDLKVKNLSLTGVVLPFTNQVASLLMRDYEIIGYHPHMPSELTKRNLEIANYVELLLSSEWNNMGFEEENRIEEEHRIKAVSFIEDLITFLERTKEEPSSPISARAYPERLKNLKVLLSILAKKDKKEEKNEREK